MKRTGFVGGVGVVLIVVCGVSDRFGAGFHADIVIGSSLLLMFA